MTARIPRTWRSFGLTAAAAALGATLAVSAPSLWKGALPQGAPFRAPEWLVESARADVGKGDYQFLPYRMTMWVVNRTNGKIIHYQLFDNQIGQVERSRVAQVDAQVFPLKDVEYVLSDRNLSSFLWVGNRVTGDFQLWRANRDGSLSTDEVYIQGGVDLRALPSQGISNREKDGRAPVTNRRPAAGVALPPALPPVMAPVPAPAEPAARKRLETQPGE